MQAITFCSIAVGSIAAASLVRDIFRSKSSSAVVPLNVPNSAFSEPSYDISSAILTRNINEGTLWLYFYENGTCRPVLAVRSPRLKKKLGVYRFSFTVTNVPHGVSREFFADQQKEVVIQFVKNKLAIAKNKKDESPSSSEVEIVEPVSAPEQLSAPDLKPVQVSTKRVFNGLTLVSATYEAFPYTNSPDVQQLRFCARFTRGSKNFVFWGSNMRRAIVSAKAEVGSVCNVIDFGRNKVSDEKGKNFEKRLYEVDLASQ